MCAKSLYSCPTICDPLDWDYLCPWNSPGKNTGVVANALIQEDLPHTGIEPAPPALAGNFFTTSDTWGRLHSKKFDFKKGQ